MYIQLAQNLRQETDESVICNLLRKGWTEIFQPSFDPSIEQCNWIDGQWIISNIPKEVPQEIPLWSFRTKLNLMGLITMVEALINSLPDEQKTIANTQWQYGNFIVRNHPLIEALGAQLGLTKDQIDDIFIECSKMI